MPETGEEPRSEPTRAKRRRSLRFRLILSGVLAIVVAWIVGAAIVAFLGLRDASHAMSDLEQAKSELSASELASGGPQSALDKARKEFSDASGLLDSPLLTPAVVLPVIGRQVTSVRDLAHAATDVSSIGVGALGELRGVLDVPHRSGPARVEALDQLSRLASTTYNRLETIDPGPSGRLLPALARRYDQFVGQLDDVRTRLAHASVVASALGRILQGPSRYLLLVANNAEMRAGQGMFLDAGMLSIDQGHIHLGDLYDTGTIPVTPGAVPISGDLAARWGWLLPSQDWRNLGLTPNFDEIGPVAASMWRAVEHEKVEGVISIDIAALQQLLEVTGPVTVSDGSVVSASNVVQLLMHDEYEGLTFSSSQAQVARASLLGSLARATLGALQDRSLDLTTLATAMSTATSGRHVELWSSNPSDESAWAEGGVAGKLTNDSLLAAVLNRSGAKLDQYLSVRCALSITSGRTSSTATLSVTMANSTPPGQSPYIAGPYPGLGTVYGQYVGFLAVDLPADSDTDFHATGASGPPVALGADGPVWLIAVPVDIKAGDTQTVVVHFVLPGVHGSFTIEPSARIPPESWTFRRATFTDAGPVTVSW